MNGPRRRSRNGIEAGATLAARFQSQAKHMATLAARVQSHTERMATLAPYFATVPTPAASII